MLGNTAATIGADAAITGNGSWEYDAAALPRGLYLLRVTTTQGSTVQKLILQ